MQVILFLSFHALLIRTAVERYRRGLIGSCLSPLPSTGLTPGNLIKIWRIYVLYNNNIRVCIPMVRCSAVECHGIYLDHISSDHLVGPASG